MNYTHTEVTVFPNYKVEERHTPYGYYLSIDCVIPIARNLKVIKVYCHKEATCLHYELAYVSGMKLHLEKEFLLEVEKTQKLFTDDTKVLSESDYEFFKRHIKYI